MSVSKSSLSAPVVRQMYKTLIKKEPFDVKEMARDVVRCVVAENVAVKFDNTLSKVPYLNEEQASLVVLTSVDEKLVQGNTAKNTLVDTTELLLSKELSKWVLKMSKQDDKIKPAVFNDNFMKHQKIE